MTFQFKARHPMAANPEGGGFTEYSLGEFLRPLLMAENLKDPAGSSFFHDGRGEGGIQCSRGKNCLQGMSGMLRREIIQIASEFHDLVP